MSEPLGDENYLHVGFGHTVSKDRIVAIIHPKSGPAKRLRKRAAERDLLLDTTNGRRTRAMIITDAQFIILAPTTPECLWQRLKKTNSDSDYSAESEPNPGEPSFVP